MKTIENINSNACPLKLATKPHQNVSCIQCQVFSFTRDTFDEDVNSKVKSFQLGGNDVGRVEFEFMKKIGADISV